MSNLTTSTSKDYGDALDQVAAYISATPLETAQKIVLIDFFKKEFKTVTPLELIEAVRGSYSGRIEPTRDIMKIQRLSTGWWGAVLQGYKKKRQELRARPEPVQPDHQSAPILSQFTGIDGKERAYYEGLERWYLENGNKLPPYGWAYSHARKYAQDKGELLVTHEDEREVKSMAVEYLRTLPTLFQGGKTVKRKVEQSHLDRAVMQVHLKRKFTIS